MNTTSFDTSGRHAVIDAKTSTGTTLVSRAYTYALTPVGGGDAADSALVASITDQAGTATTYGYDQLNRLTSATTGATVDTWTYDNNSNRTSQTVGGVTTHYAYNAADQLCWRAATTGTCAATPTGGTAYTYDGNGNQLTGGISGTNTWTGNFDQLASTTSNGPVSYAYGGSTNDQLVLAGNREFGHGLLGAVTSSEMAFAPPPVVLPLRYVRDNKGQLISMYAAQGGTPVHWYYTADRQGSILLMTGPTQNIVGSYTYDEFGKITATSGAQGGHNVFRYLGGIYDHNTGLTKLGARYYDPTISRFNQPDPSGLEQNTYLYSRSNPVTYSDPSGLWSFEINFNLCLIGCVHASAGIDSDGDFRLGGGGGIGAGGGFSGEYEPEGDFEEGGEGYAEFSCNLGPVNGTYDAASNEGSVGIIPSMGAGCDYQGGGRYTW